MLNEIEIRIAEDFLKTKFQAYYYKNPVKEIPEINKREFGFGNFGKKISSRHLAFQNLTAFNQFLKNQAPLYISYSAAYYQFPDARPMEAKKIMGSDLILEFDVDDFSLDCRALHDQWFCTNSDCNESGKGALKNCTKCASPTLIEESVCANCLKEVKTQTLKLIKILQDELGLSEGISVNYSGSKGFHVHVQSQSVFDWSDKARIELTDYLSLHELDLQMLGFQFNGKFFSAPSKPKGLAKRLIHQVQTILKEKNPEHWAAWGGIPLKTCKDLAQNDFDELLESLSREQWFVLPGRKTEKFWKNLLLRAVDLEKLLVDRQTSIDIKKILRVPNSLHGTTGLLAKSFPVSELKNFNALKECVVFSNSKEKIKVLSQVLKFELNDEEFGPFNAGEIVSVPEFVAVYLIGKEKALPI